MWGTHLCLLSAGITWLPTPMKHLCGFWGSQSCPYVYLSSAFPNEPHSLPLKDLLSLDASEAHALVLATFLALRKNTCLRSLTSGRFGSQFGRFPWHCLAHGSESPTRQLFRQEHMVSHTIRLHYEPWRGDRGTGWACYLLHPPSDLSTFPQGSISSRLHYLTAALFWVPSL